MNRNSGEYTQLATWLAIVTQLYDSRMSALLGRHDFTSKQFATLSHLARHAHAKHTISDLTAAIEVNQPGVTKIVKKLTEMGLVRIDRDPADGRKRYVSITEKGGATMWQVQMELAPDVVAWFDGWTSEDKQQFIGYLQRLGGWLDGNRL